MPFKSKRQVKKFKELLKVGTISKKTFDEFSKDTDFSKLPDKAPKKGKK